MPDRQVINAIIIEDEQPAVEILSAFLDDETSWYLLGAYSNPHRSEPILNSGTVDVIFLDIQLPGIGGMEFLRGLEDPPLVIVTTAFSEHAVEAFEMVVLDYLLKPFSRERFLQAITRAEEKLLGTPADVEDGYLILTVNRKNRRIAYSEVLLIESRKEYIHVHTKDKEFKTRQSLKQTLEVLPESFLQVHRSYVVNLEKVKAYSNTAVELTAQEVPIGEKYRNQAVKVLSHVFRD